MRKLRSRHFAAAAAVALTAVSGAVQAQWVMLARHAVGRIEQMSQPAQQSGGASYDSAAVMLDAPVDKVYAAVVRGVGKAEGVRITRQDAAERIVQFTNGRQVAGIKVSALGDDLTHMLITSAHTGSDPDAAAVVLNSVLRVCREMNVVCSQQTK